MSYILIIFLFYLVYTLAKNIIRAFTVQPNHNGQQTSQNQSFRKTYGKTHIDIIPEDKHKTHHSSGDGEYIDYQEIK